MLSLTTNVLLNYALSTAEIMDHQMRLRTSVAACMDIGKMRVLRSFIMLIMQTNNYGMLLKALMGTKKNILGQPNLEIKFNKIFLK
jgi:hypothetical protein